MLRLVLWAAMVGTACAGTTDDRIPDSKYVEYGKQFQDYTVVVITTDPPQMGTAVMIDNHVALTAAHVVCHSGTAFVDGFPCEVVVHPEFREAVIGINDLAVLRSSKPFGRKYYPTVCEGGEKRGDTMLIAGYGITGRMNSQERISDANIRGGTAKVHDQTSLLILAKIRRGGSPLPFGIAPGDSGGPMFIDGRLAGLSSYTMRDTPKKGNPVTSGEGEDQAFVRLSHFRDWIREVSQ